MPILRNIAFLSICISLHIASYAQIRESMVCISTNELNLLQKINDYRKENKLPAVAYSTALTVVAQAHVRDLYDNVPFQENGPCNPHSWSNVGEWKECCFDGSNDSGPCMWAKPGELSTYNADGYEIVMSQFNTANPNAEVAAETALRLWKESKNHNNVLLNKQIWEDVTWKAMGAGIFKGYAAVWFGREIDAKGAPAACE